MVKKWCKCGNETGVFLAIPLLIRGHASSVSSLEIGEGAPKEETLSRQENCTNFTSFIPTFTVIGKSPVWELGFPPNGTLNLDQFGETSWPVTKIMWLVTSDFPSYVIVRVTNLQTGVQAWWDIGQGAPPPNQPVCPLIMDQNPNRVSSQKGWGTRLYLPQAGCYAMQVISHPSVSSSLQSGSFMLSSC
jgi:hypothetical protein